MPKATRSQARPIKKFELITKFTAAIHPMDAMPPVRTPKAAHFCRVRNAVAARVTVNAPVAVT